MLKPSELPHYTWEDYLQWEGRWELIEGIPFAMTPSPTYTHQRISQEIARLLSEALEGCDACHPVLPVDWKIAEDTVVQPDNLVVCFEPDKPYLTRPPALIFEILSPSTAEKDRHTKFDLYRREGVEHYCIVDPEERVVKAYRLHEGRYVRQRDGGNDRFEFDLGPCRLTLDFSSVWKRL